MQQVIRTHEKVGSPLTVSGVRDLVERGRLLNLSLSRLCGKARPGVSSSTVARWLAGASTPLMSNLVEVETRLAQALAEEEARLAQVLMGARR